MTLTPLIHSFILLVTLQIALTILIGIPGERFIPVKLGRNVLNEIEIIQHRVGDEYNIQFRYRD